MPNVGALSQVRQKKESASSKEERDSASSLLKVFKQLGYSSVKFSCLRVERLTEELKRLRTKGSERESTLF